MFYKCPQCKKTWQYPIRKCPDCFLELKRIKSQKAKVVGVSKVNIPTIWHPKVPYFVLILEDEKGNRQTHKSIKEYKMGDDFSLESIKEKGAVAVWRTKYDILEAIEKTINLLGELSISSNSKILILPTMISPKHPHFAENTSPQFLESMIEYLIERGADYKNIKVASQSFNDFSIEATAQKSQLLRVCRENKIVPLDLSKTNFVKKEKDGFSFEVSGEIFNNDLVINLPILKIDPKLKVRGAIENVFKFLKKESFSSLEYLHEYEDLQVKIQEALPDYLTVAEAISIQKSTKITTFLGLILASYNAFNLERVFAEITMVKNLPEHLKNIKIEDVPTLGRNIKELQYDVERY
jgi:uncharacterized protein (DUF362 family)